MAFALKRLPLQPQLWEVWRNKHIKYLTTRPKIEAGLTDSATLRQRNGRIDTRDQVTEDKHGYPNSKWIRVLDRVRASGPSLRTCTNCFDVQQVIACGGEGFTLVRQLWVLTKLATPTPTSRSTV